MLVCRPSTIARALGACAAVLLLIPSTAEAQGGIAWQDGPVVGRLGTIAEIQVPEGYRFAGAEGARRFLELTENPPSGDELGVILPYFEEDEEPWFITFEFTQSGYVRDDERDKLDAEEILKAIRRGNDVGNRLRRERGWTEVRLIGWTEKPFYDVQTNNLTWATLGESDGYQSVNYSTRVLGRRGTMDIDLVLGPDQMEGVVPEFQDLMQGFAFLQGSQYADWREGDKVAAYGLTALIAGGAGAMAMKSGILQKFAKVIVGGVIVLLAMFKKALAALFGRRKEDDGVQPQQV